MADHSPTTRARPRTTMIRSVLLMMKVKKFVEILRFWMNTYATGMIWIMRDPYTSPNSSLNYLT